MQRYGDWEAVRELGRGGQGTVYLARHLKTEKVHIGGGFIEGTTAAVLDATRRILDVAGRSVFDAADANPENVSKCDSAVGHLLDVLAKTLTAPTLGALKTRTDRNEVSPRRFEREIQFLRANPGPEMLRVLDSAPDNSWYVSELHVAGSLDVAWRSGSPCRGSLDAAWRLLRPIAVTLGRLHQKGEVHRDVKTKNVFLAGDGRLVLGDPGLALALTDARLTETRETAASWQWAPLWVRKGRIPTPDPTHDVFSLVKLLWAMIAGRLDDAASDEFMQDHYWDHPEYDLRGLFSGQGPPRFSVLSERVFKRVLVDRPEKCEIKDAAALVGEIDSVVAATKAIVCPFCDQGVFEPVHVQKDHKPTLVPGVRFGELHGDDPRLRADVLRCSNCRGIFFKQQVERT